MNTPETSFQNQPTNREHPSWSDDWYMPNGVAGKPRYFFPISHSNPDVMLTWSTRAEYDLLRSHAVAGDLIMQLAAALENQLSAASQSDETARASQIALERARRVLECD